MSCVRLTRRWARTPTPARGSPTSAPCSTCWKRRAFPQDRIADRPGPGPRARLLHWHRLRDDGRRLGEVRQRRLGGTIRQPGQPVHLAAAAGRGCVDRTRPAAGPDGRGGLARADEHDHRRCSWPTFPAPIPSIAVSAWPRGCGRRASAPRSTPTRSRSASRWDTAPVAGHKLAVIVGPDEAAAQGLQPPQPAPPARKTRGSPGRSWKTRSESALEIIRAGRGRLMTGRRSPISRGFATSRAADRAGPRHARLAARRLCERLAELESPAAATVSQGRIPGDADADSGVRRAARAQERRGDRGEAVRAERGGPSRRLPAPGADGRASCGPTPSRRSVPSCPCASAMSGPVFRSRDPGPGAADREFTQVGVELIGAGGPAADAEVIWLADWSLAAPASADATIRIGHVGLIMEIARSQSGCPPRPPRPSSSRSARPRPRGGASGPSRRHSTALPAGCSADDEHGGPPRRRTDRDPGIDRLFRHLVPRRDGPTLGPSRSPSGSCASGTWGIAARGARSRARPDPRAGRPARAGRPSILGQLDRDYADARARFHRRAPRAGTMLGHHGVDLRPGRARPGLRPRASASTRG